MARPLKLKKDEVRRALLDAHGLKAVAARKLGVERITLNLFIERHDDLKELAYAIDEETIDFAESKLLQAINNGNVRAIIYYLTNKGKSRGYGKDTTTNVLVMNNNAPTSGENALLAEKALEYLGGDNGQE